jgi:hypothetical protein
MVPGHGLLQCAIYDHMSAGMSALYRVNATVKLSAPADAPVRRHFIAAEVVDWDYAPKGKDGCTGEPFSEDQEVRGGCCEQVCLGRLSRRPASPPTES